MGDDLSRVLETPGAERLATGFVFTEGPLWHPDGYLLFVDIRRSQIWKLVPGKTPEIIRENSGESNGMTFDAQGRGVICEMVNRRVTRMEADGSYTVLADRWNNQRLNRPNDIVGKSDGSLYFPNPGRGGCGVFAPAGTLIGIIRLPEYPANCAWGGPDNKTMFFTANPSIYSLRMRTPGTQIPRA